MPISTRLIIVCASLMMLAGCATSSHVLVGTARAPIDPALVKIYTQPPARFEEIALLDASSRNSFSPGDQRKTDKVIERLKQQAASLGANGVILQGFSEQAGGSIGTGFGSASASGNSAFGSSFGLSTELVNKTGSGMAIYVPTP